MKATLIRFGQEVDLEHPEKVTHTLVFDLGGRTLSLPVPQSTIEALVVAIHGSPAAPAKEPAPYSPPETEDDPRHTEDDLAHAAEFGGDGADEVPADNMPEEGQEAVDAALCPGCHRSGSYAVGNTCTRCGYFDGPDNEEEVASL